jgi:general secretion pathway protein G
VYLRIRDGSFASKSKIRKDQFLIPLNSDYDLFSRGKDGLSKPAITDPVSLDDVIRGNDGAFLGLAAKY